MKCIVFYIDVFEMFVVCYVCIGDMVGYEGSVRSMMKYDVFKVDIFLDIVLFFKECCYLCVRCYLVWCVVD